MSHLEVFVVHFTTSQHGWSWAIYPDHLQDWIDAWHEYQMPAWTLSIIQAKILEQVVPRR